jgi:hypothetical protein
MDKQYEDAALLQVSWRKKGWLRGCFSGFGLGGLIFNDPQLPLSAAFGIPITDANLLWWIGGTVVLRLGSLPVNYDFKRLAS